MTTIAQARDLIATTELPSAAAFAADAPEGGGMPEFDVDKDQSLVIGSDVISFGSGVESTFRQAISDSALFSQLAALRKVGENADPMDFFDAYFSKLAGLGWMIQSRDTAEFDFQADGFDVHTAITDVITAFLGPIAGAGAVVLAVLNGLHKMNSDAPFITLFNKRSVHEKIGKFQFTYVRQDPEQGLIAEIAAFGLKADKVITQVLFFKLSNEHKELRRSLGKLSIDTAALEGIRPQIAAKVMAFRTALIAEADLGPVPV
jgi:hypothetical protein